VTFNVRDGLVKQVYIINYTGLKYIYIIKYMLPYGRDRGGGGCGVKLNF
jgi:hypothetical protein